MAIKKQEFYEGAALHILARSGKIQGLHYRDPFFIVNDDLLVRLKYSTKKRSPWGFTFTTDEQLALEARAADFDIVIGLVCGDDGIAAFGYPDYCQIAPRRNSAVHIACYRSHGQHYEVNGPDGTMKGKVAPSDWLRILDR